MLCAQREDLKEPPRDKSLLARYKDIETLERFKLRHMYRKVFNAVTTPAGLLSLDMAHSKLEYYFTGPLQHDLLFEITAGLIVLAILIGLWKFLKMEWPKF